MIKNSSKSAIKPFIFITGNLFIIALLVGISQALKNPEDTLKIIERIGEILGPTKNLPDRYLFLFIFANNAIKAFLATFLFFLFGLYSLFLTISNGHLLGQIFTVVAKESGIVFLGAAILPHGILEIPAIILSAALGLRLGLLFLKRINNKKSVDFRGELKETANIYARWVLPALFAAAMIETYITPRIIEIIK